MQTISDLQLDLQCLTDLRFFNRFFSIEFPINFSIRVPRFFNRVSNRFSNFFPPLYVDMVRCRQYYKINFGSQFARAWHVVTCEENTPRKGYSIFKDTTTKSFGSSVPAESSGSSVQGKSIIYGCILNGPILWRDVYSGCISVNASIF